MSDFSPTLSHRPSTYLLDFTVSTNGPLFGSSPLPSLQWWLVNMCGNLEPYSIYYNHYLGLWSTLFFIIFCPSGHSLINCNILGSSRRHCFTDRTKNGYVIHLIQLQLCLLYGRFKMRGWIERRTSSLNTTEFRWAPPGNARSSGSGPNWSVSARAINGSCVNIIDGNVWTEQRLIEWTTSWWRL